MSINLDDTQTILLGDAARRKDRCLVRPQSMKNAESRKIAAKLIAAGLAREIKAKAGVPVWRRDEEADQSYALKLTAAGAKAFAVDEGASRAEESDENDTPGTIAAIETASPPRTIPRVEGALGGAGQLSPRQGTKLAAVIGLLRRDAGATLDELIAATGWLAHTTRAALTGLRKRGYAVALDRSDKQRGSTYRVRSDRAAATGNEGTPEDAVADGQLVEPTEASSSTKARRPAGSRAREAA
jgi:hypothetical protein